MKLRTRLLSAFMAAALLFSGIPVQAAATPQADLVTGQLQATLRLDYAQSLDALQNHDVRVTLRRGEEELGQIELWDTEATVLGQYQAALEARNADGGQDATGWPKYIAFTIFDLPRDTYTLTFTGQGYKTYTQEVVLGEYSRHLNLGTGDATFTLGDVNGDGVVDAADREQLSQHLASGDRASYATYDFNGDEKIDVVDLAYLNCNIGAQGDAELLDGALLAPPVDLDALSAVQLVSGSWDGLFSAGSSDSGVSIAAAGGSVELPIGFTTPVEMEQVTIVTPRVGGIQSGTVAVEYTTGETENIPMDTALPAGVRAIDPREGSATITIVLGKRVPVKKITITVTATETGTVSVESIQFLKDIVPENPVAPNRVVSGLTATAGSELVNLKWRGLPNVTGYQVAYWPDGSAGSVKTLDVTTPYAQISGLDNLKTYWFQVTPTAEGWSGEACPAVSATPQPAKKPNAPDMVSITELDSALAVSWKAAESATFYEVYYKEKDSQQAYRQAGGQLVSTNVNIPSLKNGVTYSVYVVAGNEIGKSGQSRISEGTPRAVDYSPPADLPKSGLLDRSKIESIRLADPNNYAPGEYTQAAPFSPNNLIDGDYRTHWTARNWYGNEHVIVTFKEPVDLQAVLWAPRLDGNYPRYLRAYSIQVWYEGEDLSQKGHLLVPDPQRGGQDNNGGTGGGDVLTWPNIPNQSSIPSKRFGVLPFGPEKQVKQISVAVEQAAYNLVNCSELMFMEYDPAHCLPEEIAGLFTSELRTQLKPGVDKAKIDSLLARLNSDEKYYYLHIQALRDELALAQELLNGSSSSGAMLNGVQSRSSGADSAKYSQGGSELQPLGVAAKANQEITVYAQGIPQGGKLTVYASQFNAEASQWLSSMGEVQNGRNILLTPKIGSQNTERGGSLYFTYTGPDPQNVQLHVRRATDVPVLELSNWYAMTEAAKRNAITSYLEELENYVAKNNFNNTNKTTSCLNVTEISTPTMLLSLPALAVQNSAPTLGAKSESLFNAVLAWEDLMHICKTTQGIDNTYSKNDMQSRQNVRCMQMFSGAFMYAAGNHIGIGYNSCAGMVGGRPISQLGSGATSNGLFGWGIAHEIGHNMDKLGRAEITNNLYSLMVQTYDGGANILPSRLENSGKYAAVFNKTAQGQLGASNDVFVQLAMYWQLHLAYDGKDQPMDFYNRFFKAWKSGEYLKDLAGLNLSYDEKVALTASGVAGRNLTDFFTHWGMKLSDNVLARLSTYSKETRAIWYLNDQSRRNRLNNTSQGYAELMVTAEKKGDTQVELKLSGSGTNVQGYEILRNNKAIAFVPENSFSGGLLYTDEISAGNHLTYSYTVKTYDTLGNLVHTASTNQIRIAYDKTVPASSYRVANTGGSLVFELEEETAVSGLKIMGVPTSGAYTVEITDKDGKVFTFQKDFGQGVASVDEKDAVLHYFTKPGAAAGDARIWTYDVKKIVVTDPSGILTTSNVRLLSYVGDDVAFLTDASGFVGRLSEDYTYGEGGSQQVVKKGTLVIAGTYRGNPIYNSIRVRGKFTTTKTVVNEDGTEEVKVEESQRDIDGETLMFAEVPADGEVSEISNGLFLFIPNVQKEAELQGATHCDGVNLLPSQIMVQMDCLDDPNNPAGPRRTTAQTLWTNSPGGTDLPEIRLEEGN